MSTVTHSIVHWRCDMRVDRQLKINSHHPPINNKSPINPRFRASIPKTICTSTGPELQSSHDLKRLISGSTQRGFQFCCHGLSEPQRPPFPKQAHPLLDRPRAEDSGTGSGFLQRIALRTTLFRPKSSDPWCVRYASPTPKRGDEFPLP